MIKLEINPRIGAGNIRLGTSREMARAQMKKNGYPLCSSHGASDYFCDNSIQLEFKNDQLRFIGISDHEEIECTYHGIDVFDIEATELFLAFAKNEIEKPNKNPGETYFFPHQGLNLWEADMQYDRKGSYHRKVYAQVGVEAP